MRWLVFILFLTGIGSSFGQSQDAVLWNGLALKYNLNKKFGLKYESQVRFHKNASVLRVYYHEMTGSYKINKRFDVSANFRYSFRNNEPNFTTVKRIALNVSNDLPIKPLDLKVKTRLRYQYDFDRLKAINSFTPASQRTTIRLKSSLSYQNDSFKRIIPFAGGELFFPVDDLAEAGISAFRLFGGIDIDLPKRHEVQLKYIFEREYGEALTNNHIYLIQYNYLLKFKSKKD